MDQTTPKPEQASNVFEQIHQRWLEQQEGEGHGMFLLYGKKGSGKTTCAGTLPKPLLFFMFDPRGEHAVLEQAKSGDIVVIDLSANDDFDLKEPAGLAPGGDFMFARFMQHYKALARGSSKAGGQLASICIDSLTTMSAAALRWKSRSQGRQQGVLTQQDYGLVYQEITNAIRSLQSLPVHFCMTAHIELTKDELLETHVTALSTHPGLQKILPPLFSEFYVMRVRRGLDGKIEHYLQVRADARYSATTRLGRQGKFPDEMLPDLRALLKRGGANFEDKARVVALKEESRE